jgi:1,4-dihydroxy-2-naphthoate octaprenyltransferase
MENEEKIMTDQDIIQKKELKAGLPSETLEANRVVDADQVANAGPHTSQALDANQGTDAEPHASQTVDARQDVDTESPISQINNAKPNSDAESSASPIVDAKPNQDAESPASQIVDTKPETDAKSSASQIIDAKQETDTKAPTSRIIDAKPNQDAESPASQIVDVDQTSRAEKGLATQLTNSKRQKNNKEKLLSKMMSTTKKQSAQIVTADSVQAEEVPTIPIGSLQTINALEPEVSVHSVASMRAISMPAPLVVQPSEYRRGLGEWLEIWHDGIRPDYLPLSLMPVILGSALAWTQTVTSKTLLGHFHVVAFILTLVAATILQIGAHLINDYYDYQHGVDTSNALGPGGLLQQGLIRPSRVLIIGLILLIIGAIIGLAAALTGGALVCLFGLIIVVCAYFFSATKKSLSALGLGELIGFVAFGLLPTMGAYMIQTHGELSLHAFFYSLPLGFLAAATIYANNMRDIEGDSHVGKNTLATLLGLRFSRIGYTILMLAAYAIIVLLGVPHGHPHYILITLWTLPGLVVAITGALRTEISAGFHGVMRQTLKIYSLFTLLLIIGLIVAAIVPALPKIPTNLLVLP